VSPATTLRVLVLCCDGLPQRNFIARVAREHELVGVALHATPGARGTLGERLLHFRWPLRLARHLIARQRVRGYDRAAEPFRREIFWLDGVPPTLPAGVPVLEVGDVNSPECVDFVARSGADVICVNGTNLLRSPMLALGKLLPLGIVNLHTGLSPYTRGGNCNLWAIVEERPEWIGVTIHHIDAGIDSGDLILTRQVPLREDDLFETIDARGFRFGFDLMLEALRQLASGRAARVPQWEEGRLYLRRTGYIYEPWVRVRANQRLADGLVAEYHARRVERDAGVRVVGERGP
jgi:folate-dependent phosphoribosylglycinamide formyltransferase PurN